MEALDYLHKFNSEFHKSVIKKGDQNALHKPDDLRIDCYDRENSRNRDILSLNRHKTGSLEQYLQTKDDFFKIDAFLYKDGRINNHEDVIIELLDGKKLAETSEDVEN